MLIEAGTIVLIIYPFTDLSSTKLRPGLVLQNINNDVIVVFISSVIHADINPQDFVLSEHSSYFKESGLKKGSIIKCGKIMTLSKSLILGEIGKLNNKVLEEEIKPRLKLALGLI